MNSIALLSPHDLERLGRENGWTLTALCREAKIAQSSFTRWKRGANGMTLRVYQRVYAVASRKRPSTGGVS